MATRGFNSVWWVFFVFLILSSDHFIHSASAGGGVGVRHRGNVITWDDMKLNKKDHKHIIMQIRRIRYNQKLDAVPVVDNDGRNSTDGGSSGGGGGSNSSRVIVVDRNGRGDSLTVQGAVDMVPFNNSQRVKIHIRPGIYREKVLVPASKPYISFIGNRYKTNQTVITWGDKASDKASDGFELGTYRSASVTVLSDYFCASGITFENSVVAVAGASGMQAVALRIAGDKAMFYGVRILGSQDTLLDETGFHFFYKCFIQGTVDFIFGRARSLYKNCVLHSTADKFGAIAAHHRDSSNEDTGFSFINCTINGSGKVYLGRAWGDYARILYSYCDIDDVITPSGWSDWDLPLREKTVVFGEFECTGKGADRTFRVPWSKSLTYDEVRPFLGTKFIYGEEWLSL